MLGVTFWRQTDSRLVLTFLFCFGGGVLGFVLFLLSPLMLKKCHRILNKVNLTEKSWTRNDLCWIKSFNTRNVLAHIVPWKLQVLGLLEKNATVDTLKPILRWFAVMQIYTKRWKDNADRCDTHQLIFFIIVRLWRIYTSIRVVQETQCDWLLSYFSAVLYWSMV